MQAERAQIYAKHKYARISATKIRLAMDLIRGKSVSEAKRVLTFEPSKGAKMTLKVLNSAISNAVNNFKLKEDDLYVAEIYADVGPTYKRGRWVGRGRYSPILKRTSHIVVGLSERKNS